MSKKPEYRIVSDGIRFKIQRLRRAWWSYRLVWRDYYRFHPDCGWMLVEECSMEDAKKTLRAIKRQDLAKQQGYRVVAAKC